jgi:DUF1680 family protein
MPTRRPLPLDRVRIHDRFWAPRQATNREVTLPLQYRILKETGRIDAFRLAWRPGEPDRPHQFWDSDVAKWIEAAGYSLATHPDPDLMARVDEVVELVAAAQQPDGYLNIYYTVVEPSKRWTNLRDMHELYCAGHLIEAAVAYYEGTGKRRLLDVMCRYADHIASVFGPGEGQRRGYPGHEEIELALVKLYRATGVERYLRLAEFFVNERGRQPHYYDAEARARGEDPGAYRFRDYAYNQAHLPIRQQTTAEGHAVRAMYLYSGVADVAAECGDDSLMAPLERLWENVTGRRMYVTGGIGSSAHGERFTYDYDLPNATAYTETCAAIGLAFWAQRMLLLDPAGTYGDVLERALYNGILSGVSLDGRSFFYSNPLDVDRLAWEAASEAQRHEFDSPERQGWFRCACCPPNVARLLASLGAYVYGEDEETAYVHLFVGSTAYLHLGGREVALRQETDYPWGERVRIRVQPEFSDRFTLALRLPGWCLAPHLEVNGAPVALDGLVDRGYARLRRVWEPGDIVDLILPMPVERVRAHPRVTADAGRVALQRGPVVYCLEEPENGANLHALSLPEDAPLEAAYEPDLLGAVVTVRTEGERSMAGAWGGSLYSAERPAVEPVALKAIPYYAWANRGLGSMLVWIREG